MKTNFILILTILAFSLSAFAQSDIRKVDFENFTYSPDFCGGDSKRKISVVDGVFFEEKEIGDGFKERMYFSIYKTAYGDLDGDKNDEAVVFSMCNTGGTGNFTEAYVFKMENNKPVRKVLLVGGDRAYGGLREARVKDGMLIIESSDPGEMGGACCPQMIVTNTYKFDGKSLKEVGTASKRKIYPETRIMFDRGKSHKRIRVQMNADENIKRYIVGAVKGQTLVVTKNSTDAKVSLWKGKAKILDENAKLVATLNETGDFIFEISNYTDRNLQFDMRVEITTPVKDITGTTKPKLPKKIKAESIYTELDADKCKTLELEEDGAGYYRGECKGVGSYKLEVVEGDIRQTINVIEEQSGDKWELDFIGKVSSGFSSVGTLAEWRVRKVNGNVLPIALIVRYNVSVPTEDGTNKNMSSLVVTKFDGEFVCITDVVPPMRKQNEKARELADVAASKPCLQK